MTTENAPAPVSAPDVTAPVPQPITPADRCAVAGAALLAAAEQLRDHAAGFADPTAAMLPVELRRRYDAVTAGPLYAVADWLDARAGLYGVASGVTVVGFAP